MNIIIKKLDLIDDVKNIIQSFCYYKNGYTIDQIKKINYIKNSRKIDSLRIKIELWTWYKSGLSIQWLKPTKGDSIGYYTSEVDEMRATAIAFTHKLINKDDFFDLDGRLADILAIYH